MKALNLLINHKIIKNLKSSMEMISPFVKIPKNDKELEALTKALEILVEFAKDSDDHPLNFLIEIMTNNIEKYENEHYPIKDVPGHEMMVYLMELKGIKQTELHDVGPQNVISDIINNKRQLNVRQIRALAKRFNLSAETFMGK